MRLLLFAAIIFLSCNNNKDNQAEILKTRLELKQAQDWLDKWEIHLKKARQADHVDRERDSVLQSYGGTREKKSSAVTPSLIRDSIHFRHKVDSLRKRLKELQK